MNLKLRAAAASVYSQWYAYVSNIARQTTLRTLHRQRQNSGEVRIKPTLCLQTFKKKRISFAFSTFYANFATLMDEAPLVKGYRQGKINSIEI
jgi:hypothetical protein